MDFIGIYAAVPRSEQIGFTISIITKQPVESQ